MFPAANHSWQIASERQLALQSTWVATLSLWTVAIAAAFDLLIASETEDILRQFSSELMYVTCTPCMYCSAYGFLCQGRSPNLRSTSRKRSIVPLDCSDLIGIVNNNGRCLIASF